ncbi:type III secretion system export apparatus subunit SctT [Enterobacter cloacae]|uniref:type III secretion system export apparatus subunit SctT n=1 Tax=Enterobacter cloacae TaxID=550 RepID=UPI002FF5582D
MLAILYLNFQNSIYSFSMAYVRVAIVFYLLPPLGERVLSNHIIKNVIISLVIIGLWPCVTPTLNPEQGWFILIIKESIFGLIFAFTLCIPFWAVTVLGEILDNQRGATISDSIDPVNGIQGSILSGFLSFAFGAIFFVNGGFRLLLDVMVQSYSMFPRGSSLETIHWEQAGLVLTVLMKSSILLSAPVFLVMMVGEVLLGVFARYCPQLNPFSLSLTIKSLIAFAIFTLYGFNSFSETVLPMFSFSLFQKLAS